MADAVTKTNEVETLGWPTPRRWTRYTVDFRVKIVTKRNGISTATYGQGTDISEGGMSAYIPMEIGVGKSVEMELILPYQQQPLKISAAVRNRRGFCYGIEFQNLTQPEREQIVRACKALSLVR